MKRWPLLLGGCLVLVSWTWGLTNADTSEARENLEEQLDQARRDGDDKLVLRTLRDLSVLVVEVGEFDLALRLTEEAVNLARTVGDRREEAWSLGHRGDARFWLYDMPDALADYQAAHAMMLEFDDAYAVASELKNIGIAYRYLRKYEESVGALEVALATFRELDETLDVKSTVENLAQTYLSLGDDRRGLKALGEGLALAREIGDSYALLTALVRIGIFYERAGLPERALETLEEALTIAEREGFPVRETWILSAISFALVSLGRLDEALATQERALDVALRLETEAFVPDRLRELGLLHLAQNPARALGYLDRAAAMTEKLGDPIDWVLRASLARVRVRLGDLDGALQLYEQAVDELESQRSTIVSGHLRTTFLEKHHSVYQELVELLLERGRADDLQRAFYTLERARARSLVEAITEAQLDIGWPLDFDLRQRKEQLEAQLARLQLALAAAREGRTTRPGLLRQLDETEQQYLRLVTDVRRRNPRYASVRYPEPLTTAEARSLLDNKTALVTYFNSGSALYAFLLTADRFEAQRLPANPRVVEARVQTYLELIVDPTGEEWRPIGRRLHAELIAPVLEHMPPSVTHLIVVPDGVLYFLPFETLLADLPGNTNQEQYLLERFTISSVPSATVLAELGQALSGRSASDREDLVLFADPFLPADDRAGEDGRSIGSTTRAWYESEGIEIPPIPHSAEEAVAIRRLVGGSSRFYLGREASEQKVKHEPLDRFRVIHFAMHGLISQRWPARSALLLAPTEEQEDGFLQAREIYQLQLASDLVVLAACRTARGRVLTGEGVQGLAQAFLHAGSQAVLASLWDVDDHQTARLMREFYRELVRGRSKADALRQAKLALLRTDPEASPSDWGGFIMIGAASRPVALAGGARWQLWTGWPLWVVAAFVAAALAWKFRQSARA